MRICSLFYLLFNLFFYIPSAIASPTPNEFEICHKTASAIILNCLNDKSEFDGEECWVKAKQSNRDCSDSVVASHHPDIQKIEAMKRAEAEHRKHAISHQ